MPKTKEDSTVINQEIWSRLKKEYHQTKNEHPLDDYAPFSNKKVWWKCDKGHEYDSVICNRYSKGNGCSYCSGKKVNETNCIRATHPDIAKEYYTIKNELPVEKIVAGSNKKVWWKCSKDQTHEWETTINSRALKNSGCPHCRGNTTANGNTLAKKFPDITKEWHPTKNEIKPSDVTPKSDIKVWWKCDSGHEYYSKIGARTGERKTGCPYCVGKKVSEDTSFLFHHPEIAKEWHSSKNELKASDFSKCSGKEVWWLCSKNKKHEWETSISNRIKGHGCPYCSCHKPCEENNLAIKHPRLIKEFNSIKNNKKPEEYSPSTREKVWWKCEKGHEWKAKIQNRTIGNKSNCPTCNSSKLELETSRVLNKLEIEFEQQKQFINLRKHRFDFYIPENNILIECDGEQHFNPESRFYVARTNAKSFDNQRKADEEKNKYTIENNYFLLRIAYTKLNKIDEILTSFFEEIQVPGIYCYPKKLYKDFKFLTQDPKTIDL